jgi:hypothetical protein
MKIKDYDNMLKSVLSKIVATDDDGRQQDIEINPVSKGFYPSILFDKLEIGRWQIIYNITVNDKNDIEQVLEQLLLCYLPKLSNENIELKKENFIKVNDYCWKAQWTLNNINYQEKKWLMTRIKNE